MSTMNTFAVKSYSDSFSDVLEEIQADIPTATGSDIVVRNYAIAVNPVDIKKISNFGNTEAKVESPVVPGYDASGVVTAVGPDVVNFKVGDEVYYAGSLIRAGTFAEYTAVDERIVGKKPSSLTFEQAATVPLTFITAFEGMVETMHVDLDDKKSNAGKVLLVHNGAGGVGSAVIQLAKLAGLTVVATASREETIAWCKKLGADHVINHREPLKPQFEALEIDGANYIFNCHNAEKNFDQHAELLRPLGHIVCIVGAHAPVNVGALMFKRGTFSYELMFTRPITGVEIERQSALLNKVSSLIDAGAVQHTQTKSFPGTLAGINEALVHQNSGKALGKTGLTLYTPSE
jgi:zinc-binding alcohol dehydrogenase family protein